MNEKLIRAHVYFHVCSRKKNYHHYNIHVASSDRPDSEDTLQAQLSVFRSGLNSPDVRQRGNRRPLNRRLHKHPCAAALSSPPSSSFIFPVFMYDKLGKGTRRTQITASFCPQWSRWSRPVCNWNHCFFSVRRWRSRWASPGLLSIAASILSRQQRTFSLTSEKCGENAGKTPPLFLRLPSPRTNNRRISVFTGIMTQSALRLAASSDRKFYLAMG